MQNKKSVERPRTARKPVKAIHTPVQFQETEFNYASESIYGVRYPRQVMVSSLAHALVLE